MIIKKFKNYTLILALVCAISIALAQASGISILVYGALAFYLMLMICAKEEYIIPLFAFFLPWAPVLKISPTAISVYSIATILVFAVCLLRTGKKKIKSDLVVIVLAFAAITLLSKGLHQYGISASYIMFLFMMLAYPLFIEWHKDRVSFESVTLFFSLGIISATLLSMLFENSENLMRYIVIMEDEHLGLVRNSGFYADPNFYAAQIITAIGCWFVLFVARKDMKKVFGVILILIMALMGMSSVSKSYLISLVVLIVVWLIALLRVSVTKTAKVIAVILLVVSVGLATGLFSGIIDQYLVRFGMVDDSSSLTTGRTDLWKEYYEFLFNSPLDLFMGQGFTSVFNGVRKGSHSIIVQTVYQFGLIGAFCVILWLGTFIKKLRKVKFSLILLLMVSCFSMWLGLDILFFDDFFVNIAIFALGIDYLSVASRENEQLV